MPNQTQLLEALKLAKEAGFIEKDAAGTKYFECWPECIERLVALSAPMDAPASAEQASIPNIIDFHNGDATMWIEDGEIKAEWNKVPAPVADEREALEELLSEIAEFSEIDESNYSHEDVAELNNWGVLVSERAEDLRAVLSAQSADKEPI